MTREEFEQLTFKYCGHLAMEDEHCLTYQTEDGKFGYCVHTPYKDGEPKGRIYVHYRIGDKVYKTKEKFIKALEEL